MNALKRNLLAPEYVKEFVNAFHAEVNRQRRDAEIEAGIKRKELNEVQRRLDGLIDAISDGLRASSLQTRLNELESRKLELQRELEATPPGSPRFHPRLSDVYRDKVTQLHGALADRRTAKRRLEYCGGLLRNIRASDRKGSLRGRTRGRDCKHGRTFSRRGDCAEGALSEFGKGGSGRGI